MRNIFLIFGYLGLELYSVILPYNTKIGGKLMFSTIWRKMFCVGVACLMLAVTFAPPAYAQQDCEAVSPFDIYGHENENTKSLY